MDYDNSCLRKNDDKTKNFLSNTKIENHEQIKRLNIIKSPIQLNEEAEITEKKDEIQLKSFDCHVNINYCSNKKINRKEKTFIDLKTEKAPPKRNLKFNNLTNKKIDFRIQRNFSDYYGSSKSKGEKILAKDILKNSIEIIFPRLSKYKTQNNSNLKYNMKEEKLKKSEEILQLLFCQFIEALEKIKYKKGKLNYKQFSEILFYLKFTKSRSSKFLTEIWNFVEREPNHGILITSLYAFLVILINCENSKTLSIQLENLCEKSNEKIHNNENSNKNHLTLIDINLTQNDSVNSLTNDNHLSKTHYKYFLNKNSAKIIQNKFKKFSSNYNFWTNIWAIKSIQMAHTSQGKYAMYEIKELNDPSTNIIQKNSNNKNINFHKKIEFNKNAKSDLSYIVERNEDKKENLIIKDKFLLANANQLFQDYKKQHMILHKKTKSN